MPLIPIADLAAQARDEDGMPLLPVFVHGLIEELGKSGQVVMRGRPVDGAGEPSSEMDIPAGDWRRMRFPFTSRRHPHDTFWNDTKALAYVEIKVDPERLRAGGARRPHGGRQESPVWSLVEPAALEWLEEYGVPIRGDGRKAEFGRYLVELVERHKESAGDATIKRHVNQFIAKFRRKNRGS